MTRAARGAGIWRSSRLQLPGRKRLFAQKSFVGTPEFLSAVEAVVAKSRPGLTRCIAAVRQHQILLRPVAERLLATRTADEYVRAVQALEEIGLAVAVDGGTVLERLALPFVGDTRGLAKNQFQKLASGVQIGRFVVEHLRRHSLVSWGGNTIARDPFQPARFSGYPFTAIGWSWLRPVVFWEGTKPSPAPALIDIFASECDWFDVEAHVARHERVRGVTHRSSPMLGVIAARHFTREALKLAQNQGLMTINLRQVFGDAALDLMTEISALLNRAPDTGGDGQDSVSEVDAIAADLERLLEHPFVTDLRALGFEALAALMVRTAPWDDVKVGISVPFQKNVTREIDVFGKRGGGREVLLVECKAHHATKPLDSKHIRRFFTETVPAFLKEHRDLGITECHAEVWTTGAIGNDAESTLANLTLDPIVRPSLVNGEALEQRIPPAIARCRRLLRTIAASG
jgi:hypothetical protein